MNLSIKTPAHKQPMSKVDYMIPTGWKALKIMDRTHRVDGIPTWENMVRQLSKMMR